MTAGSDLGEKLAKGTTGIAGTNAIIRRNDPTAPVMTGFAGWARLLVQSVTAGDAVTLHLEEPGGGLG